MGVVGNLDQYAKYQAANAIEDAANNPGGGNDGLGLGVGVALGQQIAGAFAGGHPAAPAAPPPLPAPAAIYLGINGQQVGPLARADLPAQIAAGTLTPQTLVWRQGMPGWAPADSVPEIAGLFAATPPPLPPTPA
jgi:hypothetical protein